MNSPLSAIAFDFWARNRWSLISLGLLICATGLLNLIFGVEPAHYGEDDSIIFSMAAILMGISIFFALGIFACSESDNSQEGFGFPTRLFLLPIATAHLVAVFTLIGALGISAIYLGWVFLVFSPMGIVFPIGYHLTCLTTAVVAFQASVWGLRIVPALRAVVIGALAFGFLFLIARPFEPQTGKHASQWQIAAWLLPLLLAAPLASWVTLTKERHGIWNRGFAGRVSRQRGTPTQSRTLTSPRYALDWIEWRSNGRLLIGITLLLILPGICGRLPILPQQFLSVALFANTFFLPLFFCFAGTFIARDCNTGTLKTSLFTGVMPVSIEDVLVSKLRILLTVGILGVIAGILYSWNLSAADSDFVLKQSGFEVEALYIAMLTAPALTWTCLVGGLPLWLSGRIESVTTAFAITLGSLLIPNASLFWLFKDKPQWITTVLSLALTFKLVAATIGFKIASRGRLLNFSTIATIILVWLAVTSLTVATGIYFAKQIPWPESRIVLFGILICPLARIAFCPLALEYNRHQ
ncbi:MAG: hypothetical protein JWM99_4729 [Verrucomicrobiales bacterium]|nr:hypothetical protein [Verrucomicrobiales bacterium]